MIAVNSSYVRQNFSEVFDGIVREKPVFIKKHRDHIVGMNVNTLKDLLDKVIIEYNEFIEDDGSITLSLQHLDPVVNAPTRAEAINLLIADLQEYALEYFDNMAYWGSDPQRKNQMGIIFKVFLSNDVDELKGALKCLNGKN